MDVLTPQQRRYNMSRIRGRDTRPELLLRKGVHAAGLRYRLHARELPGRPDLVFPRHRAVLLVNGCFWHGHDCALFRMPATNHEFWETKIAANRARDRRNLLALCQADWRVLVVWECSLKGRSRRPLEDILSETSAFVRGNERFKEIAAVPGKAATATSLERGSPGQLAPRPGVYLEPEGI